MLDPLTWEWGWSYEVEHELITAEGIDLIVPDDEEHQSAVAPTADVVVSSGIAPLDAPRITSLERCIGIVCYSAGTDAVDTTAAAAAGMTVTGVHANSPDVADHAMALMLAAHRMIGPMSAVAAAGVWDLRQNPELQGIRRLSSLTMGIVGAGRIGREIAGRARAFGMTTIGTTRSGPTHADTRIHHRDLHLLLRESDVIMVTAALTPETRHLIDEAALTHVRPGSLLVNVARGGLINEHALACALDDGRLRAVALDVRETEPPLAPDPLAGRPNVLQTPHMGGLSQEALVDLHRLTAIGVIDMLRSAGRLPGPAGLSSSSNPVVPTERVTPT